MFRARGASLRDRTAVKNRGSKLRATGRRTAAGEDKTGTGAGRRADSESGSDEVPVQASCNLPEGRCTQASGFGAPSANWGAKCTLTRKKSEVMRPSPKMQLAGARLQPKKVGLEGRKNVLGIYMDGGHKSAIFREPTARRSQAITLRGNIMMPQCALALELLDIAKTNFFRRVSQVYLDRKIRVLKSRKSK